MADAIKDRKIYEPDSFEEQPLPDSVIWEEIVDKPTTLKELSQTDGAALEEATAAVAGLGDLAYEDLVTELFLASQAVTNAKIAVNAIQGDVIAAGAITETKIGTDAISTAKIQAGAIVAAKIAAGTITANEIQANTITAAKMNVSELSAITANLGTVNAGSINGLTITGGTFRTAATGERIEITTGVTNQIRFFDGTTEYGRIEVDNTTDGFLRFQTDDDQAGLEINTGIGASGFAEASIFSAGGFFSTSSSASNWFVRMEGASGGGAMVAGGGSGETFEIDIDTNLVGDLDITGNIRVSSIVTADSFAANSTNALDMTDVIRLKSLIADPSSGVANTAGAMYYDALNDRVRVKIAGTWKTVTVA